MEEKYIRNFAAITTLAYRLAAADGQIGKDEQGVIVKFLLKFEDLDEEALKQIIACSDSMSDMTAVSLLKDFDPESKQMAANLFAAIVCRDDLTEEERNLYHEIATLCSLPDPETDADYEDEEETPDEAEDEEYEVDEDDEEEVEYEVDEEDEADEENEVDEDAIIPAFLVVQSNGLSFAEQFEQEDWADLKPLLSSRIGADRLEIIRFTQPLNALSQEQDLNMCHLVIIMGRDNYDEDSLEDNAPASILYGGGYPLYGHAVFALETDDGYVIEGFRSQSLFYDAIDAINKAVSGLLRFKE